MLNYGQIMPYCITRSGKGEINMEEKKLLKDEELTAVSGGQDLRDSKRTMSCPKCNQNMYVTKIAKGRNGEIIRTLHCDGCGYECTK